MPEGDTLAPYGTAWSMAAKHTLHVALTEPLVRHVRDQIATGRYATASEVLRDALRLLMERDERTRNRARASAERQVPRHV